MGEYRIAFLKRTDFADDLRPVRFYVYESILHHLTNLFQLWNVQKVYIV